MIIIIHRAGIADERAKSIPAARDAENQRYSIKTTARER
jgi:hypothetical protein